MEISTMINDIIHVLQSLVFELGTWSISFYDILRFFLLGFLVVVLARMVNNYGKGIIKRQKRIDVRTKEILSKIYEVIIFCTVALILLNIMGVNLTTLAVFSGAVGVGLGLGLQSIASNFISGIIILLDNSITIDDYIEINDEQKGFVREFRMRYTVLETYDGKDIVVPNETFISSTFINWSHKDPKQRYRVDFSVAYDTDVRSMVELIKTAVGEHPQVLNGNNVALEERPDCEIDSFGDSGINMFVEFWILGIDDGKNRVGGDLNLIILETLKNNGIEIPFPQREIKIVSQH
ncbi:MAG: Mechanosensitive channel MscK [Glaciecola sp. HTCC2999]|jgi:small-conductance mechanosensitive channel|nr:MAG: Mechanosensitive channel MscK [Glaciecola sp. HTCC2999]